MMVARIFRGLESKQTRACAPHDSVPLTDQCIKYLLFCFLVPGVIWLMMEALAYWTPVRDLFEFTK